MACMPDMEMIMSKAWYDYPVTHGYITSYEGPGTDTPHYAEDIGTPFHTPLTAPLSGTVKVANYQAWGGQVFIQPDDKSFPEYYMYHPDELEVHAGEHVSAGQLIALSGGENPGFPGAEHPASTKFSSGPHTHIGWFEKYVATPIGQEPFGPPPDNLLEIAQSGSNQPSIPSNVPASIFNAVHPIAEQNGVPDAIWETVAQVESGFNQDALGDNASSFGLFQLHIGGQFPQAFLNNPTALDDPALNAQYAMPDIAKAWHALSGTFDASNASWWQSFAAQSGHPGGSPGQTITDNEAAKLQQNYASFANDAALTGSTCQQPSGFNPADWLSYWSCLAQNAVGNTVSGVTGSIGAFFLRLGVGAAGIGLILLGAHEFLAALNGGSVLTLSPEPKETKEDAETEPKETEEDHEAEKRRRSEDAETERENKARDAELAKLQRKANAKYAREHK